MTSNRTFEKHLATVQSQRITKTNIIGIRKGLNAHWRNVKGYSTSTTAPQWIDGDVRAILDATRRYTPSALGELHHSGIAKLRDKRNARYLSDRAKHIVTDPYLRFELVDWQDMGRGEFYPVWRAIGHWQSFDYISLPWQFIAYNRAGESLTPIMEQPE